MSVTISDIFVTVKMDFSDKFSIWLIQISCIFFFRFPFAFALWPCAYGRERAHASNPNNGICAMQFYFMNDRKNGND